MNKDYNDIYLINVYTYVLKLIKQYNYDIIIVCTKDLLIVSQMIDSLAIIDAYTIHRILL